MKIVVADKSVVPLERMLTELIVRMRNYPVMDVEEDNDPLVAYPTKLGVLEDIGVLERVCRQLQRSHGGIANKLVREQAAERVV